MKRVCKDNKNESKQIGKSWCATSLFSCDDHVVFLDLGEKEFNGIGRPNRENWPALDVSNCIVCRKRDWHFDWDWPSVLVLVLVVVGDRKKSGHSRELLDGQSPRSDGERPHPSARLVTKRPYIGRHIPEVTAASVSISRTSSPIRLCCSNSVCANSSCLFRVWIESIE